MNGYWVWKHPKGQISIVPNKRGRFVLYVGREDVGNYHSEGSALSDACAGSHFSTSSGLVSDELEPSDNIRDWSFIPWDKRK